MDRRFVVFLLILIAGCAQAPTIPLTGRFFQFVDTSEQGKGQAWLQIDLDSLEQCKTMAKGFVNSPESALIYRCSESSQADLLPYTFKITNVVTADEIVARATGPNYCKSQQRWIAERLKNSSPVVEVSECK